MKEIQEILKKIAQLAPGEKGVLATVVDVKGSSYRLPGAKMLVLESNQTFGTVSGGCLETDVLERTKKILEMNEAQIFVYDTTEDENSVFSLNMGCRGIVRVLLEPVSSENIYFEFLENFWLKGLSNVVTATLISAPQEFPNKTGSKLMIAPDYVFQNDLDDDLQQKSLKIAERVFSDKRSNLENIDGVEVFFEFTPAPVCLYIFGAGADAVPLCGLAKNLGWRVFISDHRPAFADQSRFPEADSVKVKRLEDLDELMPGQENYAAVVMSHNYLHDKEIIWRLLKTKASYIGALGPKKRTEKILSELAAEGREFPAENLSKLFAPVGLDIGADTPETIALSIVAEIQSILTGRGGGFLRLRQGGIYNRT